MSLTHRLFSVLAEQIRQNPHVYDQRTDNKPVAALAYFYASTTTYISVHRSKIKQKFNRCPIKGSQNKIKVTAFLSRFSIIAGIDKMLFPLSFD